MKLVKYNPLATASSVDSLINDFFNRNLGHFVGGDDPLSTPAVNVIESDSGYRLEIAAPGLEKGDFSINLDKNLLTIAASKEQENEEKQDDKIVRREFSYSSFKRTFTLPENVKTEAIAASYDKGVLFVTLPKKEEAAELSRVISVQ